MRWSPTVHRSGVNTSTRDHPTANSIRGLQRYVSSMNHHRMSANSGASSSHSVPTGRRHRPHSREDSRGLGAHLIVCAPRICGCCEIVPSDTGCLFAARASVDVQTSRATRRETIQAIGQHHAPCCAVGHVDSASHRASSPGVPRVRVDCGTAMHILAHPGGRRGWCELCRASCLACVASIALCAGAGAISLGAKPVPGAGLADAIHCHSPRA